MPRARNQAAISIHPLLVEWDNFPIGDSSRFKNFNPPTPCGVGLSQRALFRERANFNPPTPCGVGRQKVCVYAIFLREAFIFKYRLLASIRQVSLITSVFTSFYLLSHKNYGANCPAFGRQL